jgi:hypothetical protein
MITIVILRQAIPLTVFFEKAYKTSKHSREYKKPIKFLLKEG